MGDACSFGGPNRQTQLRQVFATIRDCLPDLAAWAMREDVANENGLNRQLVQRACHRFYMSGMPYFAQTESMEDDRRGDSPSVDIGFHQYADDTGSESPRVTVLEGKRLDDRIDSRRQREYVVGVGKPRGGIERFKASIHGRDFTTAGMVGYVQTADFATWRSRINTWIAELTHEAGHEPAWNEVEQLGELDGAGRVATCESVVTRASGTLSLVHLWVCLVCGNLNARGTQA